MIITSHTRCSYVKIHISLSRIFLEGRELPPQWKTVKKMNIRDRINLIYINSFFSIGFNIFMYLVYIMNSASKIMKDQFWVHFNFMILKDSKTTKNNNKGIEPLVICKCC